MTEETLGFLGLMRRAGALALGAEDAFDAAREHRARLICLAQDAGKNTRDGLFNALEEGKSALLTLPAANTFMLLITILSYFSFWGFSSKYNRTLYIIWKKTAFI